ncbi:recombinational endonuclease subunit D13 [Bacillus phage vB_BcgM]|nr:recombinational endonuclease subunit D13 [Bacillus phage vB_BcgM]
MERYDVYKTEVEFFPVKTKMRIKFKIVESPFKNGNSLWFDMMKRLHLVVKK